VVCLSLFSAPFILFADQLLLGKLSYPSEDNSQVNVVDAKQSITTEADNGVEEGDNPLQ
jgi:hypothetical protein